MIKFQGQIPVNTDYVLYQCPKGYKAVLGISFNNTGASDATISLGRLAAPKASYADSDYQWQDYVVTNGLGYPQEWSGLTLSSGNVLIAKTNLVDVNFLVHGFEVPVIGKFTSENDWLELGTSINLGVDSSGYLTNKLSIQDNLDQDTLVNYSQFDDTGTGTWVFNINKFEATGSSNRSRLVNINTNYPTVSVSAQITVSGQLQGGLVFRHSNSSNYYMAVITASNSSSNPNRISLIKRVAGTYTTLVNTSTFTVSNLKTHRLKVIASGTNIQVYLNGQVVINTTDASLTTGSVGLITNSLDVGGTVTFKNFNASSDISSTAATFTRTGNATEPYTGTVRATNVSRSIPVTHDAVISGVDTFLAGTSSYTTISGNDLVLPRVGHNRSSVAYDEYLRFYNSDEPRFADVTEPINFSKSAKWNLGTFNGTTLDSDNNLTISSLDFTRASTTFGINTQTAQPIDTNQPIFEDGSMWVGTTGDNLLAASIANAETTTSFNAVGSGVTLSTASDAWQGSRSVVAFTTGAVNSGVETVQFSCAASSGRTFSVYVKSNVPCALKLEQWTAGGTLQSTLTSSSTTGSGTWERLSIQTVTNASTALAKMTVYQTVTSGPSSIQVDALQQNTSVYQTPWKDPNLGVKSADSFSTSASGIDFTRGFIRYKLDASSVTALQGGVSGAGVILLGSHVPSAGNNNRFQVYLVGSTLAFAVWNSSGSVTGSATQVITHSVGWHSLGWSLNGTSLKLYYDGQVYGPFTLTGVPGNVPTRVMGVGGVSTTGYANTFIKDFTLWDTVGDDLTMQQYTSSANSVIPITNDVVMQAKMASDTKFYRKASWIGPWSDTNVTNAGYIGFTESSQAVNGSVSYQFRTNSLGQDSGASSYVSDPSSAVPNRFIQPRVDLVISNAGTDKPFVNSLTIQTVNYGQAAFNDASVPNQLPTYLSNGAITALSNVTAVAWPRPDLVSFREAWQFSNNSATRTLTVDLTATPYLLGFGASTKYIFSCYVTKTNNTLPTFASTGSADIRVSADNGAGTWSDFLVTRIKGSVYRVSGVYTTAASVTSNTVVLTKATGDTADEVFVSGLALQYVGTSSTYRRYPGTLFPELDFTHNVFNPAPNNARGTQLISSDNYTLPGEAFNTASGSFVAQVYIDPNMSYANAVTHPRIFNTYSSNGLAANSMNLSFSPTSIAFVTVNSAGTVSQATGSIPSFVAGYHTIGCTWSSTTLKVYFDGALVGTTSGSINLPQAQTQLVYLGSRLAQLDPVTGIKFSWVQAFNQQLSDSLMQQYTKGNYIPVADQSTTTQVLFDGNLNQQAKGSWISPWIDTRFTKNKFTGFSLSGTNVTNVEFRTNTQGADSGASPWSSDFSVLPIGQFIQARVVLEDTHQVRSKLTSLTVFSRVPVSQSVLNESGTTNLLTTAAAPASEAVTVTPASTYWLTKYQDGSRVSFTRASTGYDNDFNSYTNNVPVFLGHIKQFGTYNYLAANASNAETNNTTGISLVGTPAVSRTQNWKMSGNYSFSVANTSLSSYVLLPTSISLPPGQPITGSAWVYNPNNTPIELLASVGASSTIRFVIPAMTSQRIVANGISLGVLAANGFSMRELSGKTFYFDQAQLELNPYVTDWVVGGSGRKIEHKKEGVLITTGYTQQIQRTEDLSNAYWTKTNITVALSSNMSPRADLTAYKLSEDNTNGEHSLSVSGLGTSTNGLTVSFFAKAQERSKVRLTLGTHTVSIDLKVGRIDTSVNPTSYVTPRLKYFGDGWWKITVTLSVLTSAISISLLDDTGTLSYAGTTGSGALIWGINVFPGIRQDMPYSPRNTASAETIAQAQLSYSSPAMAGTSYTMAVKVWSDQVLNSLQRTPVSLLGSSQLSGTGSFLGVSVANTATSYGFRMFEPLYGSESITKGSYSSYSEQGAIAVGSYPVGESMKTSGLITLAGVITPNNFQSFQDGNPSSLVTNYITNDIYGYATYTVRVGHSNNSGSEINGWVKELAIYDRALSQQEIHSFNSGTSSAKPSIYFNFANTVEPSVKNNWFRRARVAHRLTGSTSAWSTFNTQVRVADSSGNWALTASAPPTFARASTAIDQFGASVASGTPRYAQGLNILRSADSDAETATGSNVGSWSLEGSGTVTVATVGTSAASNPRHEASGVINGVFAMTVTPGTTAANQGIRQSTGSRSFVKSNTQYTVSAFIKPPAATQNFRLSVTFWNNTTLCSTASSVGSFTSTSALSYSRYTHTFTTPSDCNFVEVQIVRSEVSTGAWTVDGVQLEEGPTASGFMRGGISHSSALGNTLSSIMIEEGTTNGIPAGTAQTFQGWLNGGHTITLTQTQTDPFNSTGATRVQSSGAVSTAKFAYGMSKTNGTVFTSSVWIKNLAATPVTIGNNYTTQVVPATSGWTKVELTSTSNGSTSAAITFNTSAAGVEIDLLAFQPQIEDKPYATSYHPGGTRAAETLFYPTSAYQAATVSSAGTITILTYIDKELITGNTASRDYYLLSMGTPGAANSFRLYKASGATTALTFETVDNSGTARSFTNTTAMTKGWNLISLAWNPGLQTSLTVNGTATSSSGWPLGTSMPTTWADTYVGSASNGTGQWNQPIDDLRIWDNIYNSDSVVGNGFGSKAGMFYPTCTRNSYRLKFENDLTYGRGGYVYPSAVNLANLGTFGSHSDFRIVGTGFSNSASFAQAKLIGLPNQVNTAPVTGATTMSYKAGTYNMMSNVGSSLTFDKNLVQLTPGTVGSGTMTPQIGIVSESVGTYTPALTLAKIDFVQDTTGDQTRIVPVTSTLVLEPYNLSRWQLENQTFATSWTPFGSVRNGELTTMSAASIINTTNWTAQMAIEPFKPTVTGNFANVFFQIGGNITNGFMKLWQNHNGIGYQIQDSSGGSVTNTLIPLANLPRDHKIRIAITQTNSTTFYFFVNGVKYGPVTTTNPITSWNADAVRLGSPSDRSSWTFSHFSADKSVLGDLALINWTSGDNSATLGLYAFTLGLSSGVTNQQAVGTWTSSWIDTLYNKNLHTELDSIATIPSDTAITYEFRAANTSNYSDAGAWTSNLSSLQGRYVQIRVTITSTNAPTNLAVLKHLDLVSKYGIQ